MKKYWLIALIVFGTSSLMAQDADPIAEVATSAISATDENQASDGSQDSTKVQTSLEQIPVWKQKFYYGYNFDIYFHNDSRSNRKENGWSIALEPEIGWKLKERIYLGLRVGGSYQDTYSTYTSEAADGSKTSQELRIQQGSWNVTPYARYRLKTLFNDKVGIWLEAHLYTGMDFPRVADGVVSGTDYDGLKYSVIYGAQVSPVITYQFNRKRSFQIFFSILSIGYSGTTLCYVNTETGQRYNEYTNDVIIFSGKLRNLLANQFTPGLYGLKFGIQKNF